MRPSKLSLTALALILICAVGFGLRAYKVVEPNPVPGDDAHAYFALAKSLYADGTYGGPNFNNASDWSPGAPLLYAALFELTGGAREGSIRALQALIGLASILVVFALGRRLAFVAADLTGLLAAGAVALYPPFIHSTGAAMSEPLAVLLLPSLLLSFLWAADRAKRLGDDAAARLLTYLWPWLIPGLLAGLLALTRPEYLAVGLVFVVIVAWVGGERSIGRGLLAGSAFLVAMALPILPWTVHNLQSLDRLVPISTGSGKALFVGTFMPGDGDYQRTKAILVEQQLNRQLEPGSPELDEVDPRPLFDQIAQRHPELSRDDALGRIGREQLEQNLSDRPLDYAAMTGRKVWRMWSQGQGGAMRSLPGRVIQVALTLLGLLGLVLLARRRRWLETALCLVPIGGITAIGAITLASDRRAQILMSLILPLAALAVSAALERRRGDLF